MPGTVPTRTYEEHREMAPDPYQPGRTPGQRAYDIINPSGMTYLDMFGFQPHLINRGKEAMLEQGFELQDENERRYREALTFMQRAYDENTLPTITEDDINTMFAQEAERSTADYQRNIGAVTESLGLRGISGGLAADLAAQAHGDFQRALAQSKGNIRIAKIHADAQDRMRNINAAYALGEFQARGADETGLAVTAEGIGVDMALANLLASGSAANAARNAAREASRNALIGGIVQGGLGFLGGVASGF